MSLISVRVVSSVKLDFVSKLSIAGLHYTHHLDHCLAKLGSDGLIGFLLMNLIKFANSYSIVHVDLDFLEQTRRLLLDSYIPS